MSKPVVVMAMYRPKAGQVEELESLIRKHFPTLQEYGLATEQKPFIGKASDGTFVEVFEWASSQAAEKAHDHPAVAKIWEAMAMVCDFGMLNQLPESKKPFPSFERAF
jgi:hypothetical protein